MKAVDRVYVARPDVAHAYAYCGRRGQYHEIVHEEDEMNDQQSTPATDKVSDSSSKGWFVKDRFGMFIHWGLYSVGAWHPWHKSKKELTTEQYQKYFDHFDPDLYDPKEWARQAKAAGMKYVVITTKHHEGFCLFDSKYTEYKSTNTPCGKDLIAPFVEAFRAEGLKIGFYYSLFDWHHPDFTIDINHPQRNHPDAEEMNKGRDMKRYVQYMRDQITELLTNYGKIDIIWCDFSYVDWEWHGKPGKGRDDWESVELVKLIRKLAPDILINDRLDLNDVEGYQPDFICHEQVIPSSPPIVPDHAVGWEACHTLAGLWCYIREEFKWKTHEQLVNLLSDIVAFGGNLLMNIGPTARGTFEPRACEALKVYSDWMTVNGRAIYETVPSELEAPDGCRFTQKNNRLYVHIQNWPHKAIHVKKLAGRVVYAQMLHDASEVFWNDVKHDGSVRLELPLVRPKINVPVIEVFLKEE
ncbi:alpha-L-fucosidase [Vibrio mimicus]|uniref:alpha-L-fucosidase n=1 Tax=Vibrio mimicus TaxID=674 RepID=UPI00370979A1